jgi:ABC-type branched-subunit amino acid transport system ATPase component
MTGPNGSGKTTMFNIFTESPKPTKDRYSLRVPISLASEHSNGAVVDPDKMELI